MKTPARHLGLGAALVAMLTLGTFAYSADDQNAPANPPAASPPPAATASASDTTPVPAAPVAMPSAASEQKSELRRLDVPAANPAVKADAAEDTSEGTSADEADKKPADEPAKSNDQQKIKNLSFGYRKHHESGNARVMFGGDATLEKGEEADAVVSIFGSSTADGDVNDAVVSVLGSSTSSGDVGDAVVSVLGNTRVNGGHVGDAAVAVLGDTYVNGHVGQAAVAVMGNVELGPDAEIDGDVVTVGGAVTRDPKAIVHGHIQHVGVGKHFGGTEWLQAWIKQCVLHVRPLAFGPHLMWAWSIALGMLVLYALIALLFGGAVEKCAQTLERRPGYTLLAALLTMLIVPVVVILLCVTVVGVALVPFIAAALFFASVFGRAVMLAWIGRCVVRLVDRNAVLHAAVAVLIGGALVLLLYTVPVLGFIVYKLLGVLGLGVVVYTLLLNAKRKPAPPPATPPAPGSGVPNVVVPAAAAGIVEAPVTAGAAVPPEATAAIGAPVSVVPPPMPSASSVVISAATMVRAGFWIRLAASLLDAIIVGIAVGFLPHVLRPNYVLLFAAYCIVLWALKGTTVGGVVCSLKVVRLDDRRVDWMTALVRGLSGFLSLFAAGLGFLWVAFDDQKQSWHDKIAGTTIVVVPKGVSLV